MMIEIKSLQQQQHAKQHKGITVFKVIYYTMEQRRKTPHAQHKPKDFDDKDFIIKK